MVKRSLSNLKNQVSEEEFLLGDTFNSSGDWLSQVETEGQLAVDVYQTQNEVVVKAPIAGVEEANIDITIQTDQITIRGERKEEKEVADTNYHSKECYWGAFSRNIILPVEVEHESARASFKNGILTIRIPKAKKNQAFRLKIS